MGVAKCLSKASQKIFLQPWKFCRPRLQPRKPTVYGNAGPGKKWCNFVYWVVKIKSVNHYKYLGVMG